MLVSKKSREPNKNPKICVTTHGEPRHEQVEYSHVGQHLHWLCVGHVDFLLLVYFFLTLGSQRERSFWWDVGLNWWRINVG